MRAALAAMALLAAVTAALAQSPAIDIIIFGKQSSASGSSGSGCANQLVLNYSNSCALIGQAFGQ